MEHQKLYIRLRRITTFDGCSGLWGMVDLGLSLAGGFSILVLGFFCVFFQMVRRQRHREVRMRSPLPSPRSSDAPSASGGRVESCVRWILWHLFGFGFRWCGFRSFSSDIRLSSLAMVVALVRRSFGALARWLPVCLPQQTLLRQNLLGSGDGVAWTAARLRLALVFVVVARWSSDLFVIFITFLGTCCSVVDDY
jgi:hypothetical protein